MVNPHEMPDSPRFAVHATSDSHFSWLRTRMSLDRTMMSWVRTGTALIGFGFTIVQFFERLGGVSGVGPAVTPDAPRYLGLALIGAGIVALAISFWQYRQVVSYLWAAPFDRLAGVDADGMRTPVLAVAILIRAV